MLGLLALMEIQASRLAARSGPDGAFIPLTAQDRARWDYLLISRGLDALARAAALTRKRSSGDGPYQLQAALAACHAGARRAADTDWSRIAALYDRLRVVAPSPVVDLNRAIAHSMAFGPEAGLRLVDESRRRRRPAQLRAVAGGEGRLSVPGGSTGRGAFRIHGRSHADPQRAGKSIPPRAG